MSYAEQLRQRRKAPSSVWHKLRASLNTKKYDFFFIFEGEEDEDFYLHFFSKRSRNAQCLPIVCDGKGGVLGLHDKIIEEGYGDRENIFFFVDTDHDRFLGKEQYPKNTFNTCGYSIENYMQDREIFLSVVKKHFQIRDNDPLLELISKKIDRDFRVFERRASSIMTYVVCLRRADKALNLDKLNFSRFFEFSEGYGLSRNRIDCNVELERIGSIEVLKLNELAGEMRYLRNVDPARIIRGKLVAQFLLSFINDMPTYFSGEVKINGKPLKLRADIAKRNIIYLFMEFVEIPNRLDAFFRRIPAYADSAALSFDK